MENKDNLTLEDVYINTRELTHEQINKLDSFVTDENFTPSLDISKGLTKIHMFRCKFRYNQELKQFHYFAVFLRKVEDGTYTFEPNLTLVDFDTFIKLVEQQNNEHE